MHLPRISNNPTTNRLKKVQSKKKERAAVEDAAREQNAADAEKEGQESNVFIRI
jgi:hypothetical protein